MKKIGQSAVPALAYISWVCGHISSMGEAKVIFSGALEPDRVPSCAPPHVKLATLKTLVVPSFRRVSYYGQPLAAHLKGLSALETAWDCGMVYATFMLLVTLFTTACHGGSVAKALCC